MSGRSVRVTLRVWEDSEPEVYNKLTALRPGQRRAILGMALPIALDSIPDPAGVKSGNRKPPPEIALQSAAAAPPTPLADTKENVAVTGDRERLLQRAGDLAGSLL